MFTFQVLRDGTVTNVQMTQSSGNRSVDNSALARHSEFKPGVAAAVELFREQRNRRILFRFSPLEFMGMVE